MSKIYQKMYLGNQNRSKDVLDGFIHKVILRSCNSESHPLFIKRAGFTLIELLVVVLIIGILAAIALPQYQTAVEKSRVAQAYVLAKHFKDAEELYCMANGRYTDSFEALGVEIPAGYKLQSDGGLYGKFFVFRLLRNIDRVLVLYADTELIISLTFKLDSLGAGRNCCAYASSDYRGEQLCKSLGGAGEGRAECYEEGGSSCRCWDLP